MKKLLAPFVLLLAVLFTAGCDKADMKIKKLNHGDGTWDIVSIHYEYYDSTGATVISDSTETAPGEIVFFTTTTLDGLYDYVLCTAHMNEPAGVETYIFEVYFDEARAHFQDALNGPVPGSLNALWTVNKSSRKKQEWSTYLLRSDGSLYGKRTVVMKFK